MISLRNAPPQQKFRWAATGVVGFVTVYLAGAAALGYNGGDHDEFREGHAVDTLTALFHGMTAAFAGSGLLLTAHGTPLRTRWFWSLLMLGFLFFGLDDMLQIHEEVVAPSTKICAIRVCSVTGTT